MYLKDFSETRGVPYQTLNSYIRRNSEIFEKHKKIKNGKVWLSKKAVDMLSKKYPLAVEEENNLQLELIKAQQKIIELQNMFVNVQPKLLLLEENENELRNKNAKIKLLEEEKKQLIYEKELEYDNLEKVIEDLRRKLVSETNKSWWDKLRGK